MAHRGREGIRPLTVGGVDPGDVAVMSKAADHDWRAYLITGVATLIFLRTNTNPLIVVGAAALLATSAGLRRSPIGLAAAATRRRRTG